MSNVPANPNGEWKPSLREQEARLEHREWIGGRAITLLSHYWRDDDDDALTAAMGNDWADVLEGLPCDAIQKACIRYQREEPRRKPTPGAIYQLAREAMPAPAVVHRQPPEPENTEPRVSAERANAILDEIGFKPKRFGGDV